MIVRACIYLLMGGGLSGALLGLGWTATLLLQGDAMASHFMTAWLSTFNGLIVGATGYGLLFFVAHERNRIEPALRNAFDVPDEALPGFIVRLSRIQRWRLRRWATALITLIGGVVVIRAGLPLKGWGFAQVYLAAAVISYYLIGGYMLMVFVAILGAFDYVSDRAALDVPVRIGLRVPLRSIEIKIIDAYLVISSMLGLVAIYVAFRTTLTAFDKASPVYGLMILPLFFFVPATLVYSFYPRYVMREVWDNDTYVMLERVAPDSIIDTNADAKTRLEMRKLLIEVKSKFCEERKTAPLISFKDAPTLTLAAFNAIQFFVQKDPVLVNFFRSVFKF